MAGLIVLALVLTVVAGLAAASESALSRIGRSHAADLNHQGRRGAAAVVRVADEPAPVLSVATLVRVSAEVGAVVAVTFATVRTIGLHWTSGLVAGLIMAAASFVMVGVGPRTLGRQYADDVALVAAGPLLALTTVLAPLTRLLVLIGNAVTPGSGLRDGPFASEAELRQFVDIAQESQLIELGEQKMIHSVIDLGDTLTREVMVPRTDVVSVDHDANLHDAMSLFLRSGFSRVPVVGGGLDDPVGILYLKDVARRMHEQPGAGLVQRVESVMRRPVFVPDSKPADALLREMQHAGHAAIVVDEYGGTAGLVTIEDILEEIVGEIADEYDQAEAQVESLPDGRRRVSARMHLDELGDLFGTEIEDEEVDTVGGLLSKGLGRVPIAGSTTSVQGLLLTADTFEGRRHSLATVLVSRDESPDQHDYEHAGAQSAAEGSDVR
ncbi:hemolysin family protein [Kineosporia succinea]|uniref:CBS domain containing-hemolysin-like protein n=1 Tax=Kineosporia succinea TaxID=84632 RepID=A0ABT9P719_9ACTN|nr:hemolysin family protein [Kineosporia succinea]MDP9827985.1 CBS domain containing-hemolysin-like protein [Kineosporia succinea]